MKLGRLPRGLAVAAMAAVTVVPLAASAASAAPAAPTAYTLYGSAEPLFWGSNPAVGELRVPFVSGKTNNLAVAGSFAALGLPNGDTARPMSGEAISGLTCRGFDENACQDPFFPVADVGHRGVDPGHFEQTASFGGKDGKFPGRISAVTHCDGNCGDQLITSTSNALGPAGGYSGYVTVGASAASHELSMDDKGRLVSTARSMLENVSIGPKAEVRFSRLETIAHAFGTGAENAKDGRADLKITDFYILDNRVELTPAGLRLAKGPSEQEAYDGAKTLLNRLRKEHGIVIELPNFEKQLVKTPAHAAVETKGLRVRFERSVGSVSATAISSPLDLGRSTAVVAALDADRNIEVNEDQNGDVVVQTTAPAPAAPAATPGGSGPDGPSSPKAERPGSTGPRSKNNKSGSPSAGGDTKPKPPTSSPGDITAPAPTGTTDPGTIVTPPDPTVPTGQVGDLPPGLQDPQATALPSIDDLQRNLGLEGARSVSRAFGAFLGLGLILPLARFVIRRLG